MRSRLRSLILFTLLPVAIFGIAGAWVLVEREGATFERGARDRVRALTTAIDAELYAVITPLEVARRLKADAGTRRVRLLALTGYGAADDRRRALAAGFDEHVAKPVEAATLERLIA